MLRRPRFKIYFVPNFWCFWNVPSVFWIPLTNLFIFLTVKMFFTFFSNIRRLFYLNIYFLYIFDKITYFNKQIHIDALFVLHTRERRHLVSNFMFSINGMFAFESQLYLIFRIAKLSNSSELNGNTEFSINFTFDTIIRWLLKHKKLNDPWNYTLKLHHSIVSFTMDTYWNGDFVEYFKFY